jgi:SpoIID/LytB domain protein
MNIMNRSRRLRRRLAFALALMVSSCAQTVSLVEARAFAGVMPGQQRSAPSPTVRASQNKKQSVDKNSTRSLAVEPTTGVVRESPPDGPIIRVALMTDVTSVALSCSSGLMVNRGTASFGEGKKIPAGSLQVELRQQSDAEVPLESSVAVYSVIVRYTYDSRVASNLVDELKKKFFEPVTMTFDENQNEYAVLIGQYRNRNEAAQLSERLRKAGYEGLRIVSDPKMADAHAQESVASAKARAAKYQGQPGSAAGGSIVEPDRRPTHLVAIAADKITASSEDELIVVPADGISSATRIKRGAVSYGDDQKSKRIKNEDLEEMSAQHETTTPAAVRVGKKDYRGEIHLVLNASGLINVVNVLPLEDYLRGVVLMEIPMGVPRGIEALKAQAVAARSYALSHLGQHNDRGYDLVNDARAQTYGGLSAERELTNRAIDETRGVAAVYVNESGKVVPIEALYTANCGGRTENNEEVFGGKPRPYLRSVVCSPDRQPVVGRDIVTSRTPEPLDETDGRLIAREVATLSVLGFSLPRRVTGNYLQGSPDRDEIRNWTEQTARLTQREKPSITRGETARLADFANLVAELIYGEGRASTLLDPADVDYLLAGMRVEQLTREARADVANLLRDGILHLRAGAGLDGRALITRGQAIETLARALLFKSTADLKSQVSNLKSQITEFKSETSAPAEKGRLILAAPVTPGNSASRGQARFTSLNTSGAASSRSQPDEPRENKSPRVAKETLKTEGIEIAEGAWLFRSVGGESYPVDRLTLIGGERVTYHLNAAGQADFLEASVSAHSASSERLSGVGVGRWQERVSVEDLQQRLAHARISVGQPQSVEPVAFSSSSRVSELEITGKEGRTRLRGRQIIGALGLKETLFVVAPEKDARGRVIAFVFTGKGWGHGVGMCQNGAYGMAQDGYSYTAIIQKYYTGVKVQEMY